MEPHEASAKERGEGVLFERVRRITGYLVGTLDRFNNALRRAGIGRRLRPYDLRHAFASHALDHGADRKCVAEVMGHKNEGMLLQIYQHTLLRQRRRAVNAGPGLHVK